MCGNSSQLRLDETLALKLAVMSQETEDILCQAAPCRDLRHREQA